MPIRRRRRRERAQTLIEAIAGFAVIIPLALMAIDLTVLVTTSQSNEQWAELAARIAASQSNEQNARLSAESCLAKAKTSNIVQSVALEGVDYDLGKGQVTIKTKMLVNMPVPFPFLSQVECHASAIQPIVATPAPL
ncbi:MAG: hypothetical protein J0M35_09830 [Candidatus Obscuribacter phosphatis]|uniref:Uncharacterized protein n=1 Tax=Candidatus Obscuribacter phosphatis TaxID=1906157 RepID=A0A8J7TM48_9BACT|nr:hypothetical protein [Candidatus Obscuribacter phosphatis]